MSGLILNEDKCEIVTLGKLRGDQVTVRTLKYIDLTQNYMKILGISFSYNKSISNKTLALSSKRLMMHFLYGNGRILALLEKLQSLKQWLFHK